MAQPEWAAAHAAELAPLLWRARGELARAVQRVWVAHGVPPDLAHALPHACRRSRPEVRNRILRRLAWSTELVGSLRRALSEDSESEGDNDVEPEDFQLCVRASLRRQPSPSDPSTRILLRLAHGPTADWAVRTLADSNQFTADDAKSWTILKETRYRDTSRQKALCGFEPQTTCYAYPRGATWHARECPRHPLRLAGVGEAEWFADPFHVATQVWVDELDYYCCCHIDWP